MEVKKEYPVSTQDLVRLVGMTIKLVTVVDENLPKLGSSVVLPIKNLSRRGSSQRTLPLEYTVQIDKSCLRTVKKQKCFSTDHHFIQALNEWDSRNCNGVDWRRKLDSQRGAVLATELKNNSGKLAKWTMSALLAG